MAQRKYSVGEIDRMRNAISFLCQTGFAYMKPERDAEIEQKLRTYMLNGTDPEELEKMVGERQAFEQKMRG